jgi:hypothetical protein
MGSLLLPEPIEGFVAETYANAHSRVHLQLFVVSRRGGNWVVALLLHTVTRGMSLGHLMRWYNDNVENTATKLPK